MFFFQPVIMLTVLSATLGTILGVTTRSTTLPAKKTCHPSGITSLRKVWDKFEIILRKVWVKIEKKLKKVAMPAKKTCHPSDISRLRKVWAKSEIILRQIWDEFEISLRLVWFNIEVSFRNLHWQLRRYAIHQVQQICYKSEISLI